MEVSHHRSPRVRVARAAGTLAMAACLLLSCSTQAAPDHQARTGGSPTAPGSAASPVPQPGPDQVLGRSPAMPVASNAPALARRIERAAATLRDRRAAAD